jgi:hypothetical protein
MKKQSSIMFASLNKEAMENFTTEIKETLAPGWAGPHQKPFTEADLWAIRSHAKFRPTRRYL